MLDNSSENIKKDTLWKIIESRDASLERLLKECHQASENHVTLLEKLDTANRSLAETQQQVNYLAFQNSNLLDNLAATQQEVEKLKSINLKFQNRVAIYSQTLNELNFHNFQIKQHNAELKNQLNVQQENLNSKYKKIDALQEKINSLNASVETLQIGRVAFKQVIKSLLRKTKTEKLLTIYKKLVNKSSSNLEENQEIISPKPELDTSSVEEESRVESASVKVNLISDSTEALIVLRGVTFNNELDIQDVSEEPLRFFSEIVSKPSQILCISPDARMASLIQALAYGGAEVFCFACSPNLAISLQTVGVKMIWQDLGSWMVETQQTNLSEFDVVCLGQNPSLVDWALLHNRLSNNTKIITQADVQALNPKDFNLHQSLFKSWEVSNLTFNGLKLYDSPPSNWKDPLDIISPLHQYQQWPWHDPNIRIPSTLPSGKPWPKISVVTVTFNQGKYIEETIRSILQQNYPNLEYILIDACSTDNTHEILGRYKDQFAHCIIEPDKGQSDALNKGFSLATGDILAWLNSDDCYVPDSLFRVALAFDRYVTDMVAGGVQLREDFCPTPFKVHHSKLPFGEVVPLPTEQLLDLDKCWQQGHFFYQPEVFWTRELWERSGGKVLEDLFYSMDYELWVRMSVNQAKIVHIPEPLVAYRVHEKQKTYGDDIPFLPELTSVRDQFLSIDR